jgi:hypothetical protein
MSYDEDALYSLIDKWARKNLIATHLETKNVVPQIPHAELAYEVTWSGGNSAIDITTINKSLQAEIGPIARLSIHPTSSRTLIISIMPMPNKAVKRIEAEVRRFTKMLDQWSLRTYVLIFCVTVALFLYFSLELYNHWREYSEPWDTPLEFLWYHTTPFFSHKHE